MTQTDMLIGGTRVQAEGGRTFERRNPIDQQLATVAPLPAWRMPARPSMPLRTH